MRVAATMLLSIIFFSGREVSIKTTYFRIKAFIAYVVLCKYVFFQSLRAK
jgi:hypothetical protein